MSKQIKIAGIDKIKLLEALWAKQKPAFFFDITGEKAPKFDKKFAEEMLEMNGGYFDYFCGRRIKTNIGGDYVDPRRYDYDLATGPGTFKKIVTRLKKNNAKKHD